MTLTRLSHHATLLSCLRGRHLSGTDRSIALSLFLPPTVLRECYHQMFWAAATQSDIKPHLLFESERGAKNAERQRWFLMVHSSKPLVMLFVLERSRKTGTLQSTPTCCGVKWILQKASAHLLKAANNVNESCTYVRTHPCCQQADGAHTWETILNQL